MIAKKFTFNQDRLWSQGHPPAHATRAQFLRTSTAQMYEIEGLEALDHTLDQDITIVVILLSHEQPTIVSSRAALVAMRTR